MTPGVVFLGRFKTFSVYRSCLFRFYRWNGSIRAKGEISISSDTYTPMLGAAYYPEAWPDDQPAPDIAAMVEAGTTVVRTGKFAWSRMEPREGEFHFEWLHRNW